MTDEYRLLPNPKGIRILTSVESDRLKKDYPGLPPSPFKGCVTCGDTKSFRYWNDDNTEVVSYQCDCAQQWILSRYLLYNGIGMNFQRLGWRQVQYQGPEVIAVHKYIGNLDRNLRLGTGLYLYGDPGTGKTLLGTLILRQALSKGVSGHFTTFREMQIAYEGGWKDEDKSDWFRAKIRHAGILVIDDPGKEMSGGRSVEFSKTLLDDVIRHRTSASLPTIITSNDTPAEFRLRYGGNVASLLDERMIRIATTGGDFRPNMEPYNELEEELGITRPITLS